MNDQVPVLSSLPDTSQEETLKWRCIKVTLWIVVWVLFIFIEFGAVYFVVSLLYFVYCSTRRHSLKGPSAYSVFNPNCERIDGTFTAEEFENRLRHGGL